MKRRAFIKSGIAFAGVTALVTKLSAFELFTMDSGTKMPVLFVGHGNPMNAIMENEFTQGWRKMISGLGKPKAILCISAHWETNSSQVIESPSPKMIYDMYGFPQELYQVQYPAPGNPEMAKSIAETIESISTTNDWGYDHGTWSILVKMFPEANIPCFQLSLNRKLSYQQHVELANELKYLRNKGVLIIGSGNIVHNLRQVKFKDPKPYDWALEFDDYVKKSIENFDTNALVSFKGVENAAQLSVNSAEHYLPLLYTMGLADKGEQIQHFNELVGFGSLSMRSIRIG